MIRGLRTPSIAVNTLRQLSTKGSAYSGSFLPVNEVTERVIQLIKTIPQVPHHVTSTSSFAGDLKLDSELKKTLNNLLSREFCVEVPADVQDGFVSIPSVVQYFSTHPKARYAPTPVVIDNSINK